MAINTEAIKKSVEILAPHGTKVSEYFYDYMFRTHPEVRPMFPQDMGPQTKRLLDSVIYIASNVDNLDNLVPYLNRLGVGHKKYNTRPQHFPVVGEALMATLEHFAGPAWTPELEQSWSEAYALASDVMIKAAQ